MLSYTLEYNITIKWQHENGKANNIPSHSRTHKLLEELYQKVTHILLQKEEKTIFISRQQNQLQHKKKPSLNIKQFEPALMIPYIPYLQKQILK